MARSASPQPTEGELEILKLLWDAGPCELGALCAAIRRQRDVATTTVATMLKVMLDKGLAKRSQGPRGWLWSAKVGRTATSRRMLKNLLDDVFEGSAQLLVSHLLEDGKLSAKDRRQIRALLDSASDPPTRKSPPTPKDSP